MGNRILRGAKFFSILLSLVLFSRAWGQEPILSLRDFSGGMVTKVSTMGVKPNQCKTAINVNFSHKYGEMFRRLGYEAMTDTLLWKQDIYGLYGNVARSGKKNLHGVVCQQKDSTLIGLGDWVVSANFAYELDTSNSAKIVFEDVYTGATPFWATWKDDVFMANGRQRPMIYHNGYGRDLTPLAPGEPRITPMDKAPATAWGNGPYGEYRYMIRYYTTCGSHWGIYTTGYESYISQPIKAYNEKIQIEDFITHCPDSTCDTTAGDWATSIVLDIYRTRANPGIINKLDTFFYVAYLYDVIPGLVDTATIIDSIPDDSLGNGSYASYSTLNDSMIGYNTSIVGRNRLGAMTFISRDPYSISIFPDSLGDSTKTNKVIYFCTVTDTITGFESDSGRTYYIKKLSGDSCYKIGIPPLPYDSSHYVRNIYRAYNYCIYSDTTSMGDKADVVDTFLRDVSDADAEWIDELKNAGRVVYIFGSKYLGFVHLKYLGSLWQIDTVTSPYYKIATITDSDVKYFVDTISWDSAIKCPIFSNESPPVSLVNIVAAQDRLWGSVGSRLYWSFLDTAGRWEAFDNLALGIDDADDITAIVPFRDYIKVYKHNSQYLVYKESGDYDYGRQWLATGYGCIAPHSMATYGNAIVYLSNRGVEYEIGSQTLEKVTSENIISTVINDQLDFTPTVKRTAVGIIHDNKYWLSFPSLDTTWIYDFTTGGWTKYTYAFEQATKYDTNHYQSLIPANDLLFIQDASDKVWKADTMATDNSLSFTMRWEKDILHSNDPMKINKIGVWIKDGAVGSKWSLGIYNEAGTHIWSDSASHSSGASIPRYREFGPLPYDPDKCHFYTIRIESWGQNATQFSKDFSIDGIDIWAEPVHTTKIENIEGH